MERTMGRTLKEIKPELRVDDGDDIFGLLPIVGDDNEVHASSLICNQITPTIKYRRLSCFVALSAMQCIDFINPLAISLVDGS
jgi:hypothetical protein